MSFEYPWALVGLAVVAGVAAWAYFRPGRQMAVVASLELWRQAAQSRQAASAKRLSRLSASWLLLLAGAVLAVVAAGRPVWHGQTPARHVAIAVYPSAELAGDGGLATLKSAASALVNRLGPDDLVQVILPTELGGAGPWQSPRQALERVGQVAIVPVGLADMPSLQTPPDAQHCYVIAPPGRDFGQGPSYSVIRVPPALSPVTIEAAGIAPANATSVELFASFCNNTSASLHVNYRLDCFEPAASRTVEFTIAPMGREQRVIANLPPAAAYALRLVAPIDARAATGIAGAGSDAYFVRRQTRRVRVAIAGQDQPMLRKYAAADPMVELVESAKDAHLILAQGTADDFGDKPAMIFAPAKPPPGWGEDKQVGPVPLADADRAADDKSGIMQDVDLSRVVVRQVRPWTPYETAGNTRVLLRIKSGTAEAGGALVLRSTPEDSRDVQPRRLYVAFGIDESNTNFVTRPSFVIFMANAVRWLAEKEGTQGVQYVNVSPMQAGAWQDWQKATGEGDGSAPGHPGGQGSGGADGGRNPQALPWPGLYKDSSGQWHAVSLTGLASQAVADARHQATSSPAPAQATPAPQDYAAAIAALPLPPPKASALGKELWPVLLLATMLMWLAGWTLRLQ